MIHIQGLHKFFNKGRQNEIHVINDVSLDLPEKGMVAIFGKSGCGKTTLLNVIGGLDKYAGGELTIEGQDIRESTDVIRNKYIGYIFQNYNLNKGESCFENVADALRLCGVTDSGEIEKRVTAALTNVGMEKYSKRSPDTLSGGQQQRIAIARAIVKNPPVILADEPTGNLDEANTVMIMDLLKAIAKDHLVLLVTHESKLVDYYCDTVIELSDGKVVSVRNNSQAQGFTARDKNHIYLGELDKEELVCESAYVEYYGDKPQEPIKLKIVNSGGKIYVQLGTDKVQILDESSEVKLREGVYKEQSTQNTMSQSINMEKLPPVKGTRFGRLFSLKSSIKSGYTANFKDSKKRRKGLRGCMCLFAAVIVFMSAVFGSSFGDIIEAKNSYNHNVFYLYTPNAQVSQRLVEAVGNADTGIDYLRLSSYYPTGDKTIYFHAGNFETFELSYYEGNLQTNAVYLDVSLTKDMELVEGKKSGLANEEILISTKVADALLEKSALGYISEREDLIGLISNTVTVDGKSMRVAGIVDSDEPAIYLTELAMAKYVLNGFYNTLVKLGSDYGIELDQGEAVLAIQNKREDVTLPSVGEEIKIHGSSMTVTEIKEAQYNYNEWLNEKGIIKLYEYEYFRELVKKEQPQLIEDTDEFYKALDEMYVSRYYEYFDYFYSETKEFFTDYLFFSPNYFEVWLYVEKDIEAARHTLLPEEYYKAIAYKELYGRYPTQEEMQLYFESLPYAYEELKPYYEVYENEFYSSSANNGFGANAYMVSDADYIAISKQLGETHPSATNSTGGINYGKAEEYDVSTVSASVSMDLITYTDMYYTVIHSSNPEKTDAWLRTEFEDLEAPSEYYKKLLTPDNIFDSVIESQSEGIITSLITMAVMLVLMSVCMYFIMRSSLMVRIKEVGIYRAIGVTKRNLIFKFFIEAVVLTTLTVLVGYLIISAFLYVCLGISSLVGEIFYYPPWLAACVLAVLYIISLFFGTLPILSLLRKTPSEILAKYDI